MYIGSIFAALFENYGSALESSVKAYPAEFQRAEPLLRSQPDYYATPGIKKMFKNANFSTATAVKWLSCR